VERKVGKEVEGGERESIKEFPLRVRTFTIPNLINLNLFFLSD